MKINYKEQNIFYIYIFDSLAVLYAAFLNIKRIMYYYNILKLS